MENAWLDLAAEQDWLDGETDRPLARYVAGKDTSTAFSLHPSVNELPAGVISEVLMSIVQAPPGREHWKNDLVSNRRRFASIPVLSFWTSPPTKSISRADEVAHKTRLT